MVKNKGGIAYKEDFIDFFLDIRDTILHPKWSFREKLGELYYTVKVEIKHPSWRKLLISTNNYQIIKDIETVRKYKKQAKWRE